MKVELPDAVVLPIEEIRPYWRNPRRIPQEAIEKVARSIEEFGYEHQPIVVDVENVVIVGHTRLSALKHLGRTEVMVYVSKLPAGKAAEYRLVDNRTSEMSGWDNAALVTELREFEQGVLEEFFPDLDLEIGSASLEPEVTGEDIKRATDKVTKVTEADPATKHTTDVVCPSCFRTFAVRTKSLPGVTRADLEALAYGEAD